jgi:hypothetical protein
MQQIKSIGVLQTSKVVGCLYLVIGLVIAAVLIPITLIGIILAPGTQESAKMGLVMIPILLLVPVYALLGFVFAAFFCWLYNVIAKRIGGIELEIQPKSPSATSQVEPHPPLG